MKDQDHNPAMNTWIDPELEARIVAWVAGEASPFEIAELERLMAEKPELAIFKRRIAAVHGLVSEAARPDKEPMQLSAERRAKVLAVIGTPAEKPPVSVLEPARRRFAGRLWWFAGVAASMAFGVLVFTEATKKTYHRSELKALENEARQRVAAEAEANFARGKIKAQSAELQSGGRAYREIAVEIPKAGDSTGNRGDYKKSLQTFDGEEKPQSAVGEAPARITFSVPPAAPVVTSSDRFSGTFTVPDDAATSVPVSPPRFGAGQANLGRTRIAGISGLAEQQLKQQTFNYNGGGRVEVFKTDMGSGQKISGPATTEGLAANRTEVTLDGAATISGFTASTEKDGGLLAANTLAGSKVPSDANAADKSAPAPTILSEPLVNTSIAGKAGGAVALSPFEVKAGQGYYAANTLSGTRLNTSVQDLASSITVVTKQQLADAAAFSGGLGNEQLTAAQPGRIAEANGAVNGNNGNERASADADDRGVTHAVPMEPPPVAETSTAQEPVSTFSLHVSDVSFRLAQSALARGEMPGAVQTRPEEIYNAFDYGDPAPLAGAPISCRIEQSAHPFLQQRNLVRIAMKVPATGRGALQPLHLTLLLDTSGSMEREDRVASVRRAMEVLVSLLSPEDRVTLIGFARQPRLLAENVAGDRGRALLDTLRRTPAEGGTNLEEALKLASELARRHQQAGAQNRIVLLTDGAANLGDADPARLGQQVETLRQQGIAFDACGVGLNGLDDAVLESLTRKGDGRYYVLDSPEAADAGFARQLAGAFRPAAENVKLQVRFNPARVARYRLIGFEQHRLRTEDFRNDGVDAAELAADEAAVALYQVEVLPQGEGELGEVFVRFRDPATSTMVERSWTIRYDAAAPSFDRAPPAMQLAGAAALFAEKLRGSPLAGQFKLGDFTGVVDSVRRHYASQPRVQEFVTMFGTLRRLRGE